MHAFLYYIIALSNEFLRLNLSIFKSVILSKVSILIPLFLNMDKEFSLVAERERVVFVQWEPRKCLYSDYSTIINKFVQTIKNPINFI